MPGHNVLHDLFESDLSINDPDHLASFDIDRSPAYCDIVTTTLEYRTLNDPARPGLMLFLHMLTDGGDCTVVAASAVNSSGNTFITFNDAGDWCQLISISDGAGAYRWEVLASSGVSLS